MTTATREPNIESEVGGILALLRELTGKNWRQLTGSVAEMYSFYGRLVIQCEEHIQWVFLYRPNGTDGPNWAFSSTSGDVFDAEAPSFLELFTRLHLQQHFGIVPMPKESSWRQPKKKPFGLRAALIKLLGGSC